MMIIKNSSFADLIESYISPFVQRIMHQKHITGLSVALVGDSQVLFSKGYGFADIQTRKHATPSTLYKIGSITKVFTGTAAMQLAEKGLLDLDKSVTHYLPEFSIKSRFGDISQITPRALMTHHSGLPADWVDNYWNPDPYAFRQVIDYLRESYLTFQPNTIFSYSNLATSLMGVIIERVSGLSYQDYVIQNLLAPLKMINSKLDVGEVQLSLLSKAYARDHEVEDPVLRDVPAGAIISNVQDMSYFLSMVLSGGSFDGVDILGSKSLNEMITPQNATVKLDLGFQIGLNWILGRPGLDSLGRVCWHDGGTPHFYSILIALPGANLGVVVLSNSDGGMINVGIIADEILRQAAALKYGTKAPLPTVYPRLGNSQQKESQVGVFASPNGIIQIFERKKALRARIQGNQFSLIENSDGWYGLRLLLLGFLSLKIASIASLRLAVHDIDGQRVLGMEQYGFWVPLGIEYSPSNIPKAWAESVGEYHLITTIRLPPMSTLKLKIKNSSLYIQARVRKAGSMSLVLQPTSDTEATVIGFGRVGGATVELIYLDDAKMLKIVGLKFLKSGI